jgi:hypothetical protein
MSDYRQSGDFKLGRHEPGIGMVEHRYDDVCERRTILGREALVLAPATGHIDLLLRLARELKGPFRLTYVLLVPFGEFAEGRYEFEDLLDYEALERLLTLHRGFFEGDARHHLQIGTESDMPSLVYDQHDLIYAFGPVARWEQIAKEHGLRPGSPEMPIPHSHHTRREFDLEAESLLSSNRWRREPLGDSD